MTSALLYLQYHSLLNRLRSRIRRLKKPKYLAAAVVGGLYFYWYFFRFFFRSMGRYDAWGGGLSPNLLPAVESLGALALFVIVFLSWLVPHQRAALTFTEAEIAFLFPAPISRRDLIHFKLLRSQFRILISVLFLTLLSRRLGGSTWTHAIGLWLIFSTLSLHFLGSSFARTMLLDRGISNWLRRLVVLGVALVGAAVVVVWARRTLPAFSSQDLTDLQAISDYSQRVLTAGPALYLLYPFRLLVRPILASDVVVFLLAVGPALLLFALHYAWVIRSNVAFEEASVEASRKLASRLVAIRAGKWRGTTRKRKRRRPWFRLAPTGPAATALLWKNLISAGQAVTSRIWISVGVMLVAVFIGVGQGEQRVKVFIILSVVTMVLLLWSVLIGPQVLRQDFRQDLEMADVLKSYPMRGWQIVTGELLAPAVILVVVQWLLLVFGVICLLQSGEVTNLSLALAIAAGAAFMLPALDLIVLLIPNAAVLLFPSWIQIGRDAPRGIEAIGQRLIFMLGQLLVFVVTLVPAVVAFAIVFLLLSLLLGRTAAFPLAALGSTVVLALEAGLGVMLLGRVFERFDLSEELRG